MKNLRTILAVIALMLCFIAAESQAIVPGGIRPDASQPPPVPDPIAKAFCEETTKGKVVQFRANWTYKVPMRVATDPWQIVSVKYLLTTKVYASIQDSADGKGESPETTAVVTVSHVNGEEAPGIINTMHSVSIAPKKMTRIIAEMVLTGTYTAGPGKKPIDFTWSQKAGGLFFGEGVK